MKQDIAPPTSMSRLRLFQRPAIMRYTTFDCQSRDLVIAKQ